MPSKDRINWYRVSIEICKNGDAAKAFGFSTDVNSISGIAAAFKKLTTPQKITEALKKVGLDTR